MVATAKRKPKTKRKGPVASRAAKPSANGKKKAGQSGKFAPEQPPIKGLEDTDERVPALDELCSSYLADGAKRKQVKENQDATAGKIKEVIKEKDLDLYIYQGRKFYIEPGAEELKCAVVKQGQ